MLISDEDKSICEHYSRPDGNGQTRCDECPLVINLADRIACLAVAYFDEKICDWVMDQKED